MGTERVPGHTWAPKGCLSTHVHRKGAWVLMGTGRGARAHMNTERESGNI